VNCYVDNITIIILGYGPDGPFIVHNSNIPIYEENGTHPSNISEAYEGDFEVQKHEGEGTHIYTSIYTHINIPVFCL
jgi:hypothetical protein